MNAKLSGKKRLEELEAAIRERGVHLAYERLQFAGLKLNSGLCWFRGRYYLFVDRFKSLGERIDLVGAALEELDQLAQEGRLDNPAGREGEGESPGDA